MFGGLRQGSIFYIFNKTNDGVELKKGVVEDIKKYGNQFGNYTQTEPNIDIKVRCGEEVFELKQLPTNQNITSCNGLVVSDNQESMSAEVEATQRTSKQIIDSQGYHNNVVEQCDIILRDLNPQFAKEKEQEEKIGTLEIKMGNIENTLASIQSMLSTALSSSEQLKTKEES